MATPQHPKTFPSNAENKLPKPFILRRLHSFLGLWLVLYLFEHLLINSRAAFFFQDEARGFISLVNKLEALPYLPIIELVFLFVPFAIHMVWGLFYARRAKLNAHVTDGSKPQLPQYKRNRAFSWQRITSYLLLPAIILHVVQMRYYERPLHVINAQESYYTVNVEEDKGLKRVASILGAKVETVQGKVSPAKVLVMTPNAGSAYFLVLRQTFKSPMIVILYSLFVIAASYHACNGLWTATIVWGIALTRRSQRRMRTITNILMSVAIFLGLLSVWGVYWTTQFQI